MPQLPRRHKPQLKACASSSEAVQGWAMAARETCARGSLRPHLPQPPDQIQRDTLTYRSRSDATGTRSGETGHWREVALAGLPVPCKQPLVPTGVHGIFELFSNKAHLAGAPLRNRTVDLLLTMQPDTVWPRPAGSCYGTSGQRSCLAGSGIVCRSLGALSLGLSLTSDVPRTIPGLDDTVLKRRWLWCY
jgi:hypothetical protein